MIDRFPDSSQSSDAPVNNMEMAFHRKQVAGSLIGNLPDTQDILYFCAKHGICPNVELIYIGDVNGAYEKVEKAMFDSAMLSTWPLSKPLK